MEKKANWREAIAIDFDGCLCQNEYPKIGEPNWGVISAAQKRQREGAGLILWTCREGSLLNEAISAAERWGLRFDAVNESLPEWKDAWGNNPRKVGATEYWDDRAVKVGGSECVACGSATRAGFSYCPECGRALKRLSGQRSDYKGSQSTSCYQCANYKGGDICEINGLKVRINPIAGCFIYFEPKESAK